LDDDPFGGFSALGERAREKRKEERKTAVRKETCIDMPQKANKP
jgi:hypothetical protein